MRMIEKFFVLMLCLLSCSYMAVAEDLSNSYRLGAGDKIKIHVFQEPDLDVTVRLGNSGEIHYPFLGKLAVAGMRREDLEKKLTKLLLDGYLMHPQVRVSIEEFRSFFVNGEVKRPGAYPYKPGLNIRKGISLSGGLNADADQSEIYLIREGFKDKNGVKSIMSDSVRPGDIIMVKKSYFFVNGEVKRPGKYTYHHDMTYRQAISIAGGITERGDESKVYVTHELAKLAVKNRSTQEGDLVANIDAVIKSGDVLTIRQSFF